MADKAEPKVFISYSWSSADHEKWVVTFAEELASQGIDVVLDKWDLQPGHDANSFMESMVTDETVTKVIMICDKQYVEKSNKRSGGAGTEAQIITPGLYAKRDQNKFLAVIRERDDENKPYVPVYYGSRIYIDLTNPATYGTEFDRIVRWIWDEPLFQRPEKGEKPSFLSPSVATGKIASSVGFRRATEAIKNGHPNAVAIVSEYLNTIAVGLESFRLPMDSSNAQTFDDLVVQSIEEFRPYRNELIQLFSIIAQYALTDEMLNVLHRFFERLIAYLHRPTHVHAWNDHAFDNFQFIVHELFLYVVGVFISYEKYDAAVYFINNEYYWENVNRNGDNMHTFRVFRNDMETLSHRNRRLDLRRLSLRADMLHDHSTTTGVDFKHIMAADFVLYLRSQSGSIWEMWWPETLLYAGRFGGTFELFARAKSVKYFDRIKVLLNVNDKAELGKLLEKIMAESDRIPRWQHHHGVNPSRMLGMENLATVP